jgi:hypothetical protein
MKLGKWDNRHSHSPSAFNKRFHTFYKEFFDKGSKQKQQVLLKPKRSIDPCEENEKTGTRMPAKSTLAKNRDVYGELGWIPNFNFTVSKNNEKLHRHSREYFDAPLNYHGTFNS